MAKVVTFEVQTLQGKAWTIESIHNEREDALREARDMASSKYRKTVRVLQEVFDDVAFETYTTVAYSNERETVGQKAAARPAGPSKPREVPKMRERRYQPRRPAKAETSDFTRYVILLVVSIGGLGLMAIGLGLAYLNYMGG